MRGRWRRRVSSQPLVNEVVGEVKKPLYVLMGAVGCLLLIACLNLSNLLVARAAARRKEIAIRTALGSSRARLCREQLTESLLICVAGGAVGLVLAVWATRWLTTRWVDMPRAEAVHPDGVVVAFAMGITLVTGILSGLLPAISATSSSVLSALQDASRASAAAFARDAAQDAADSRDCVDGGSAGVRRAALQELSAAAVGRPGMPDRQRADDEVFSFAGRSMRSRSRLWPFTQGFSRRCARLPGVEAAGLTNVVPGDGYYGDTGNRVSRNILHCRPACTSSRCYRTADPGYFAAMGIPLIKGRVFTEDERGMTNDKYIVINQQFAREFFFERRADWEAREGQLGERSG